MDHAATLHRSIEDRTARLTIVGQGYVGLPLAVEFARAGFPVSGLDADLDRVVALNLGQSCTPDVTNEELAALLKDGRYEATVDGGVLERMKRRAQRRRGRVDAGVERDRVVRAR